MQPQVLAALVQALLFCAMEEGVEPIELLHRAGLTLAEIEPLYKLVPANKVLALLREIDARRPDLSLGLMMGMRISTARMGPLGYLLSSAPTVGRALQEFVQFQRLLNGGLLTWDMSSDLESCLVHLTTPAEISDINWVLEAPIALILTVARELSGQQVLPLSVSFRHPPRGDARKHEAFFGVPVRFNAPDNELVLSAAVLELPVQTANRGLYASLRNSLDAGQRPVSASAPASAPILEATRLHVARELAKGPPDKLTVARQLGMSTTTLFRQLRAAGSSFKEIVAQIRREKAVEYLADSTIRLSAIAELVGYSEHSPFFRAFVRWFGCTPAEYRAALGRRRLSHAAEK